MHFPKMRDDGGGRHVGRRLRSIGTMNAMGSLGTVPRLDRGFQPGVDEIVGAAAMEHVDDFEGGRS